jgi:hypothetical protein
VKCLGALALALLSYATQAATVLESCPLGAYNSYANAPLTTTFPVVWSIVPQGDAIGQQYLRCQPIAKASPLTWYVKYSADGGTTWKWSLLAALSPPTPPAATPTVATITWVPTTLDVNGGTLTNPVTYTLYRGPSAASLVAIKSGLMGLSTTDSVTVNGTYWYSVTAVAGGLESAKAVPVSATLTSGVVASPAPPASLTVH